VQFSEAVTGVSETNVVLVNEESHTVINLSNLESSNNNSYTFNLLSNLDAGTRYSIQIREGIFSIATGTEFTPGAVAFFTTGNVSFPEVRLVNPTNGAVNVLVNSPITALFSEAVTNVESSNVTLESANGTSIPFTVTNNGNNSYTFTPTQSLALSTNYNISFESGIQNADNGALKPITFSFATQGPNPTVVLTNPTNNESNVFTNTTITASFNTTVTGVNSANVILTESLSGIIVPFASITNNGNSYTFTPNSLLLFNTTYTISFESGIQDLDGVPLNPITFSFITDNNNGLLTFVNNTYSVNIITTIAITPNGKYAYISNFGLGSNIVSQYSVGNDGQLTPLSPVTVATGTSPQGIAITPNSNFAYVTNNASATVSQYSIGNDGQLTPLNPATVTTGTRPFRIAITPNGIYAYVTNNESNTVSQYSVGSNGQLESLSPATVTTGTCPQEIVISPNGNYAYVTNFNSNTVSQYSVASNGQLESLSPATVATGTNPRSVAITPDGRYAYVGLTVSGNNIINQYSINANGSLTPLNPATAAGNVYYSLAIESTGRYLYAGSNSIIDLFTIGNN
jgi:6-phosphogluconolactonase (cycloisomerase 2 family)